MPERVWEIYEPYARLALAVAREAESQGVLVRLRASREDWRSLLRHRSAVALFAHRRNERPEDPVDRIEFADRCYAIPELVPAIPEDYEGVLDFTVCYSLALAPAVKTARPRCTVVMNKRAARLDYRLAIYRQLLRLLATGGFSYVDALAEVQLALLRHAKVAQHSLSGDSQ